MWYVIINLVTIENKVYCNKKLMTLPNIMFKTHTFFYNNNCTQKPKQNEKTYSRAPTTLFGVDGGKIRSKINTSQRC